MSARVFISHRPGDGADMATALAEELDALFGDGQIVRIDADPASERALARRAPERLAARRSCVVLVSPEPASAGDGAARRGGARAARRRPRRRRPDPAAAGRRRRRLPPEADLPAPFERLSRLPRLPLRQAEWPGDIARLGEDLRGLGLRPLAGTQPGTMPLPLPDEGPTTTPMPLETSRPRPR